MTEGSAIPGKDGAVDRARDRALDAALSGDPDFGAFNDAYVDAMGDGQEVGRRGKKVKVLMGGGKGSRAESYDVTIVCPDCGRSLHSKGVRFVPGDDDPPAFKGAYLAMADGYLELQWHRYRRPSSTGCPAYRWRAGVKRALTCKAIRRVTHFGLGFAWRNLDWDRPLERWLYRALKSKDDAMWKASEAASKLVGKVEQPMWDRRRSNDS